MQGSSNSLIQFDDQHGTKSHRMRLQNSVTMMFCSRNHCLPHLVQYDPLKEVVGGRSGSPTNYHLLIVNMYIHIYLQIVKNTLTCQSKGQCNMLSRSSVLMEIHRSPSVLVEFALDTLGQTDQRQSHNESTHIEPTCKIDVSSCLIVLSSYA